MITRTIEYHPANGSPAQPITVTIGPVEPDPHPGGDWQAWLKIEGFPEPYALPIYGVDGVQATHCALCLASVIVRSLAEKGSRLTFLGEDDPTLGFPQFPRRSMMSRARAFFSPAA